MMSKTLGAILALSLLGGCGSDNSVSKGVDQATVGGGSSSGFSTGANFASGAWSGDVATALATYSSSIACTYGGARNTTASYYITSATGLGVYTNGYSGTVIGDIYLGRSVFGDLMAIQKIGSGSAVTGYNVYLELCDFTSYGVPLVGNGRAITNLGIDTMTLGSSASCTYDLVLKASIWLEVGTYGSYPATSFPTSFFPIDTNLRTGRSSCNNSSYSYWNPYSTYSYQ